MIGADAKVSAFTILAEWRDPTRRAPKDRDFALGLGPVAVTAETFDPDTCFPVVAVNGAKRLREPAPAFDWQAAVALAAEGTKLYPGDLLAGPSSDLVGTTAPSVVEIEVDGIGVLEQRVGG